MSLVREIRPGVHWVGAIDWDRRLFDSLIPLPEGTSYNSYLVRGKEKTALIDAVDATMVEVLEANLRALGVYRLDYVISNHAEQDHSGTLKRVLELYPEATVLGSPKCKDLLVDFGLVGMERVKAVEDGATLSLGGRTLKFVSAPWVHWPDTIFTYLVEDRVLFTCDFLGSHLATSDLYALEETFYGAAKRYYAEIMMPFKSSVKRHLERIKSMDVDLVAPSHGPLYDRPKIILEAYEDWSSDEVKNEVVLPYVSMHGSTEAMVDHLVDALIERGITVGRFELTSTDVGRLAMALVDAATLVIGSPTVLAGPHPQAIYAAALANALRPKTRFASFIGSYGWGGKMVQDLTRLMTNLKVELIEPVVIKGHPREEDFWALDKLADEILERHRKIGVAKVGNELSDH